MAVGTGNACTLIAVKTNLEAGGTPTISSLQDAVDNADAGGLNPSYGAVPIESLWEFQGYEHPSGYEFDIVIYDTQHVSVPSGSDVRIFTILSPLFNFLWSTGGTDREINVNPTRNMVYGLTVSDGQIIWTYDISVDMIV